MLRINANNQNAHNVIIYKKHRTQKTHKTNIHVKQKHERLPRKINTLNWLFSQ